MSNRYCVLPDRRVLAISGADRVHFLQGLVTQDVTKISATHAAYSLLLNAQGKFLFDFFLIHPNEQSIWLEMDAAKADALMRLLTLYKLRADVTITPLSSSHHVIAVMGDTGALSLTEQAGRATDYPDAEGIIAFTDPRLAAMGARVIAEAGTGETWLQQRGFALASPGDYARRRVNHAIPEGDDDNIPERTLPLENGLDLLHAIDFNKGCYVGQEVTARSKFRANLHKALFSVRFAAKSPLPPAGTSVMLGEREMGRLGSSHEGIGLAVIRSEAVESGEPLTADGQAMSISRPVWRT